MSVDFGTPYQRPALPLPTYPYTIPARNVYTEEDPRPHCNVKQVMAVLLGTKLSNLKDCNGTLDTFNYLVGLQIQTVTDYVVKLLRCPYDWCFMVKFFDGSGGPKLTLPEKNIRDVTTCYIRVLPSNVWYAFARPRKVDGSAFWAIGAQEPLPVGPETFPINVVDVAEINGPIYPTGIEDADLLFDPRRSTLTIPPRVLYAGLSLPLWNYTFVPGDVNIEVHYSFGFPPTAYLDGTPLTYTNGLVNNPSLGPGTPGIDWSSGIPTGISMSVAKLVANAIRSQKWFGMTDGLSSLSVDGASESYGSGPYGGALDKDDEKTIKQLTGMYARQMVL